MLYYPIFALYVLFHVLAGIAFLPLIIFVEFWKAPWKADRAKHLLIQLMASLATGVAWGMAINRWLWPLIPGYHWQFWAVLIISSVWCVCQLQWDINGVIFSELFGPASILYLDEHHQVKEKSRSEWYKQRTDPSSKDSITAVEVSFGSPFRRPTQLVGPGSGSWKARFFAGSDDRPTEVGIGLSYRKKLHVRDVLELVSNWKEEESLVDRLSAEKRVAEANERTAKLMAAVMALYAHIDFYKERYRSKPTKEIQELLKDVITEMRFPHNEAARFQWCARFKRQSKITEPPERVTPGGTPAR